MINPLDHPMIRRVQHAGEWYFSMVDVMRLLTSGRHPRSLWYERKQHLLEDDATDVYAIGVRIFRLLDVTGCSRETDCGTPAAIFRVVMGMHTRESQEFQLAIATMAASHWELATVH